MLSQKSKIPALCEELPYWDFVDDGRPHMILHDGSLSTGIRVKLIDIESLDDADVNQFTNGLRSALNSLSEEISLQFVLSVGSDFSEMIDDHAKGESETAHPLVKKIASYRKDRLNDAQSRAELYKPELTVYIRVPMIGAKRASLLKGKEVFSEKAHDAYAETMEVLSQNVDTLTSTFQSYGLVSSQLTRQELVEGVYRFLNPKRSKTEPVPLINTPADPDLEKSILENSEWLANQSPREQLVFGDLILGFEHYTLDSTY